MVSNTAYAFGPSGVPCAPLTVDRVNDGHSFTSQFPLFQLPLELYSNVTQYLDSSDLKSLSLVDRDCLKLSRCIQFADVKIDKKVRTGDLLANLNGERESAHGQGISSLGQYVRRITVCTLQAQPYQGFYGDAHHRLLNINLQALPNLHVLDLATCTPSQELIESVANSSVRHLRLSGMKFEEDFSVSLSNAWPLETLVLDFSYIPAECPSGTTVMFVNSILRVVASTLRQLVWKGEKIIRWQRWPHSFPDDMPSFPVLRHLVMDSVLMEDQSVLSHLLGPNTRIDTLCMDSMGPPASDFVLYRGYISTLQNFCWINHFLSSHTDVIAFIQNNSQIRTFDIANPLPSDILDPFILPALASNLGCLTSLSLTWADNVISKENLAIIGSMRTLQHLWLSAGCQYGWRHDWEIDHKAILEELKPLVNLQTIAFSRDSYRVRCHPLLDCSVQGYYVSRSLPDKVKVSDYLSEEDVHDLSVDGMDFEDELMKRNKMAAIAWERWHCSQMTSLSQNYADMFLNLQWCFVGQFPFEIQFDSARTVVPLTEARDYAMIMLKQKWGLVDENF